MELNIYSRKICDRIALKQVGAFVQTVSKDVGVRDIIGYSLDIKPTIKTKLKQATKPIIYKADRLTDVYIFTSEKFSMFEQIGSHALNSNNDEMYLMGQMLWTDDEKISVNSIPSLEDTGRYNKDNIYCVRLIHKESDWEGEHKVDEVVIYIPNRYFN